MNPYQLESIPFQYGAMAFPNTVPSSLNNGFGMVPHDPGNGIYDAAESLSSMFSMSNPLVGAGIGFLGNVMGKAVDSAMQIGNQKTLMDYQTQINSPQAMMARMQQAGINPAAAAQGISGAPAAGAASGGSAGIPTGSPSLIDTLANSENTRLNAEYLKSQERNMNASTLGLELDNKMKAIETGTYGEYRQAEIRQLVESANQMAQNILNLEEQRKNLIEERNNIKQNFNNLVAQEDELKAKKRLEDVERSLRALEMRIQQETLDVGYAPGTPEYNLKKAAIEAAKKGIPVSEYQPYKDALQVLYDNANAPSRGAYDSDPGHQTFREAKDAVVYLQSQRSELSKQIQQLKQMYYEEEDEDKASEIMRQLNEKKSLRAECDDAIENSEKAFKKESYKNGYHTQWQNSVDAIVKGVSTGIGIGIGAVGSNAVGRTFGASKAAFGKKMYDEGYAKGYSSISW